jgi:hypothetical protein
VRLRVPAEHHVAGLDVAVEHPRGVGGVQAVQQPQPQGDDVVLGQPPPLVQDVGQCPRRQSLHDHPGLAVFLDDVKHEHGRWGGQPGRGAGLVDRPSSCLGHLLGSEPWGGEHFLDGDRSAQQLVLRRPDDPHAAAAQYRLEPVPPGDPSCGRGPGRGVHPSPLWRQLAWRSPVTPATSWHPFGLRAPRPGRGRSRSQAPAKETKRGLIRG